MIHFKGLCIEADSAGDSYRILPQRTVTLAFRDVNVRRSPRPIS